MPCSCRCGYLCPQGFLWCHLHTKTSLHRLGSQSTQIEVFKVTKNHQCNSMGKTFSSHFFFSLIKPFWHHSTGDSATQHLWSQSPRGSDNRMGRAPCCHSDLSCEADIVRVKFFRNTVYAHAKRASVDDVTFKKYWKDIRDTLVRLGGATYKVKNLIRHFHVSHNAP